MQLTACRALISGASGGIGQALVEHLCAGGAHLLLVGRPGRRWRPWRSVFPRRSALVCADLRQREGRARRCWRPRGSSAA